MAGDITGSLFFSYKVCRLRAWYDLHADRSQAAKEPARLQQLLRSGAEHEHNVYHKIYPDSTTLSGHPNEDSFQKTVDLMKAGTPVILQGVLKDDRMTGVPDVLEHVGKENGTHRYRVGDIKYSETVRSSHVLQLAFYNDLLSRLGYAAGEEAFVIDRYLRRTEIKLTLYAELYQKTLSELQDLLIAPLAERPPIRLTGHCRDCKWRKICMPEVDRDKHISLLPMLTEDDIIRYSQKGIRRIEDLPPTMKQKYAREIGVIASGSFLLQEEFNTGVFRSGIPATVNVSFDDPYEVTEIIICRNGSTESLSINERNVVEWLQSLNPTRLFLYGRDYDSARRFCDKQNIDIPLVDIFSIVNRYVHAPLESLELDSVANFAVEHSLEAERLQTDCTNARLNKLLVVLNWLNQLDNARGSK